MSYLDIAKLRQKKFGVPRSCSRSPTKNIDGVGVGGEKTVFSGVGVGIGVKKSTPQGASLKELLRTKFLEYLTV